MSSTKNTQYENIEITLPQEIYDSYLKVINEIPFTRREIDIVACILSGRSTKKIASFLSLSPKTVENHIRNLRLKLGCRSQENIIDFIEKSNQFTLVKKYYSSLLIQTTFELELKKISASVGSKALICLIVYCKEQKDNILFIYQLEKHLNLVGVKTSIDMREGAPNDHAVKLEISSLIQRDNKTLDSIIFLLLNKKTSIDIPKQLLEYGYIDLAEEGNYYFLVFEILRKLLPTITLDQNILEFKRQYEIFHDPFVSKIGTEGNKTPQKDQAHDAPQKISKKTKRWILFGSILCLTSFYILFLTLEDTRKFNYINNQKQKNNLSLIENGHDLNKISMLEAKEICKVPEPCGSFSGRLYFINKIKDTLRESRKIIIVGYQGMGKTQLSYQYAKENSAEYEGGTYFFKADSEQSLINSIRLFSIAMGIATENEVYRLNDDQIKKLIVPLLQDQLEKQKKMLFIFDNADSYDSIKDLISIQSKQHHIIITSCSKKWDAWDFLELKEFDKEKKEAELLILKVLKKEIQQNAQKLAKKLGYYPLAITQAINYLKNNNMITIDDYIREYESLYERRKVFLSYHSFKQDNYIKTSLTAFEISKNILVKELADAYYLLKLCSYFSYDIIPASIFKNDIKNISSSLEILNKYSMLDIINIKGELFLNMHNVLRDSIKIQIHEEKEEQSIEERVLKLIDEYFVYNFWDRKNIEKVRLIIPHVENFLNSLHKKNSVLLKTNRLVSVLSKSGAYYIYCFRDTKEAIRLLEKAKYLAQFIESEQARLTNRIMEDLATSYYYHGEYNEARQEIQLIQKRNGSSELSFIIQGHILYNECRYEEAQVPYEKAMKILETVENPQHLALVNRSLGLVFYRKLQYSPAEKSKEYINLSKKYLEKALELQEKFNGENLEFAITKHAYGRLAIKLKEFDKAGRFLSEALKMATDYCKKDEDHYEILIMKRSYGHYLCLYEKDRFEEGVKYLKEALEGKIRIYQDKPHQAVIGTMELIADVFSHNSKDKELIKLIPMINRYLDDWPLAEKKDQSKNINNQIIDNKIHSIREVISKTQLL